MFVSVFGANYQIWNINQQNMHRYRYKMPTQFKRAPECSELAPADEAADDAAASATLASSVAMHYKGPPMRMQGRESVC